MSDDRPHIVLERLKKRELRTYSAGGGGTYPRTDYKRHANKIFKQAGQFAQEISKRAENNPADRVYFRVALPKDISAWSTKGQTVIENLHSEIVASPSKNVTHVSTRSRSFDLALEELVLLC